MLTISEADDHLFDAIRFGAHGYLLKDLRPEHELSPERGRRMTLEPDMVTAVVADGRLAWPSAC